ncbi:MAG: hypothetical protein LQ350_000684 [Teloschistes chrysophthalmus]|nr:MAG: hypothetical protein LQ350_000684 [Niorma chrysophthalma]
MSSHRNAKFTTTTAQPNSLSPLSAFNNTTANNNNNNHLSTSPNPTSTASSTAPSSDPSPPSGPPPAPPALNLPPSRARRQFAARLALHSQQAREIAQKAQEDALAAGGSSSSTAGTEELVGEHVQDLGPVMGGYDGADDDGQYPEEGEEHHRLHGPISSDEEEEEDEEAGAVMMKPLSTFSNNKYHQPPPPSTASNTTTSANANANSAHRWTHHDDSDDDDGAEVDQHEGYGNKGLEAFVHSPMPISGGGEVVGKEEGHEDDFGGGK